MNTIEHSTLLELLDYCPNSGQFTWKNTKSGVRFNRLAGSKTQNGYITIVLNQRRFLAHRLAWAYVYGTFPEGVVDHINRIKEDNRICNLRSVTQKENGKNVGLTKANSTGCTGVMFRKDGRKNPWNARVMHGRKEISLGHFGSFEEACAARKSWDQDFWNKQAN